MRFEGRGLVSGLDKRNQNRNRNHRADNKDLPERKICTDLLDQCIPEGQSERREDDGKNGKLYVVAVGVCELLHFFGPIPNDALIDRRLTM